jgi:hypothetical protein
LLHRFKGGITATLTYDVDDIQQQKGRLSARTTGKMKPAQGVFLFSMRME